MCIILNVFKVLLNHSESSKASKISGSDSRIEIMLCNSLEAHNRKGNHVTMGVQTDLSFYVWANDPLDIL